MLQSPPQRNQVFFWQVRVSAGQCLVVVVGGGVLQLCEPREPALQPPPACPACLLLPRRRRPAGDLGWYFHFYPVAAKYQEVWLSQVPPVGGGGHIVYASRFPAGTQARLVAVVATCVREACACGSVDAVKRMTPTGVSRAAASPPVRLAEPFCTPPAVLPAVHHLPHLPLVQQPQLASHPGVLPGPGASQLSGLKRPASGEYLLLPL